MPDIIPEQNLQKKNVNFTTNSILLSAAGSSLSALSTVSDTSATADYTSSVKTESRSEEVVRYSFSNKITPVIHISF
jgi:hypothetical protein